MDANFDSENIDIADIEETSETGSSIGYPVHIYFHEFSNMYMNQISWQWHPEIEVIIVNHGEVAFQTHDNRIVLKAGQGVVINANVMHCLEPASEDSNCSLYSTVFHPAFLFGYGDVLVSDKYLVPVLTSPDFQYIILDENDPVNNELLVHINGVIADNLVKKFGFELSTKAKLCYFWIALINIVAPGKTLKKPAKSISLDESRAKDMILYIEQNYAGKISLDDLAESVHISKSECCRCFKRALNLTPIEYLMKFRIFKSASMIQNNDPKARSFSDLAFNVGFNNASYFNKVFRQYLGCTPSEYRRKIKTDAGFDPFKNITL